MYVSIVLLELMLLVTAIVNIYTNRLVNRKLKWEAIASFSLVASAALSEAVGTLTDGGPSALYYLHLYSRLVEFCCAPFIGVMVGITFGWTRKPLIPLTAAGIHAAFQLVCFPLKLVFSVDKQNVFHRELLYPVYAAVFLLSMAYCFAAILQSNRRYHSGNDSVLMLTLANMMVGIVNQSERRHATGFESQILHHALRRSKGKLAARRESARHKRGLEASLKVVDGKVVVAVEAYEIVLVAFVVAEKQVLAVHRTVVLPPFFRFFNGFSLGMVVAFERYVVVA